MAKNLAGLCLSVLWKVELVSDEIGHLAESIYKQIVEKAAWLPLTVYSKTRERREMN